MGSEMCIRDSVWRGGEGLMIKNMHGLYYGGKRSYEWLKFKNSFEEDFNVIYVNFDSDDDEVENPYGRFHLRNVNHDLVVARIPTQEWRERLIEHGIELYMKLVVTVKYQEKTRDGGLRHPIVTRVREV